MKMLSMNVILWILMMKVSTPETLKAYRDRLRRNCGTGLVQAISCVPAINMSINGKVVTKVILHSVLFFAALTKFILCNC